MKTYFKLLLYVVTTIVLCICCYTYGYKVGRDNLDKYKDYSAAQDDLIFEIYNTYDIELEELKAYKVYLQKYDSFSQISEEELNTFINE